MRAVRGWCYLLGCVGLLFVSQCTLPWRDMRGFPCDNDAQCGPSLACTADICGGPLEASTDAPPEQPAELALEDAGQGEDTKGPDTSREATIDEPPVERPPVEHPPERVSPEPSPPECRSCGEGSDGRPDAVPPLSQHAKWVQGAGGEYSVVYQRNALLPVGKDAIYVVGAYRVFPGATPPQSKGPGTYGFLARFSAAGSLQWVASITGDTPDIRVYDLAAAPDGTLVLVGMFYGTATFGSIVRKSRSDGDAFAGQYDPKQRKWLWVSTWGSPGYDEAWKVVINPKGEVFVAGNIKDNDHTFTADGKTRQPMTNKRTGWTGTSGYLLKLTPQGAYAWHHLWASRGSYNRTRVFPDLRSGSHVYVLVNFKGALFDIQDRQILTSAGSEASALLRLKTEKGSLVQALSLGGQGKAFLGHLTQEPKSGDLLFGGSFEGTWSFTTLAGATASVRSTSPRDGVLMRTNLAGKIKWLRRFGGVRPCSFDQLVLLPDESVVGVGGIYGPTTFDHISLSSRSKANEPNGFIARFSAQDGRALAAWSLLGPYSVLYSVKAGPGGLYLSGVFRGEVQFGAKTASPSHARGGSDNFVLHFVP